MTCTLAHVHASRSSKKHVQTEGSSSTQPLSCQNTPILANRFGGRSDRRGACEHCARQIEGGRMLIHLRHGQNRLRRFHKRSRYGLWKRFWLRHAWDRLRLRFRLLPDGPCCRRGCGLLPGTDATLRKRLLVGRNLLSRSRALGKCRRMFDWIAGRVQGLGQHLRGR